MQRSNTEKEELIAPQELRELLTRLTEQSTEGIRADEPRTLAGLALETGIPIEKLRRTLVEMHGRKQLPWRTILVVGAVIVLLGLVWLWPRSQPSGAASQTNALPIITEGLVPLTDVTYGPEGGAMRADPSFSPAKPLPLGISVAAETSGVIWGAGDHHAKALTSELDAATLEHVRTTIVDLLRFVRSHAGRRNLPLGKARAEPGLTFDGPAFQVSVMTRMYSGSGMVMVALPGPDPANDADATNLIRRAAEKSVDRLQSSLRFRQSMNGG